MKFCLISWILKRASFSKKKKNNNDNNNNKQTNNFCKYQESEWYENSI